MASAIFLGESGSEMFADYERVAANLIDQYGPFRHETWNPGNAQSHVLSSFIGGQLLLPISNGRLDLGTWQRVIFLELDGPRQRSIGITGMGVQSLEERLASQLSRIYCARQVYSLVSRSHTYSAWDSLTRVRRRSCHPAGGLRV